MSRGVCISQSGVSAHCDPVLKDCFIEGLVVINGRVEQSTESKVSDFEDSNFLSVSSSKQLHLDNCRKTRAPLYFTTQSRAVQTFAPVWSSFVVSGSTVYA